MAVKAYGHNINALNAYLGLDERHLSGDTDIAGKDK